MIGQQLPKTQVSNFAFIFGLLFGFPSKSPSQHVGSCLSFLLCDRKTLLPTLISESFHYELGRVTHLYWSPF